VYILNFSFALRIILVLSIVLQSFSSIASVTSEDHQVDIEHLQIQHDHADDRNILKESADKEPHDIKDCHHCGHCSGSHLSWILVSNSNITSKVYNTYKIPYQSVQTKEILDAILRPPIS